MSTALYVRESLTIDDAFEQRALALARARGLVSGDTLVIAAAEMAAQAPGYVLDLRDPADPAYLLNVVLIAGRLTARGMRVDVSGGPATAPGAAGAAARSVRVFAGQTDAFGLRASGGDGAAGVAGRAGADGSVTIEFDDNGKPHRFYEEAGDGQPGQAGGAGGNGGTAVAMWGDGPAPAVEALGGTGGLGGPGGPGGKGAPTGSGSGHRPNGRTGAAGATGATGLAGSAIAKQLGAAELWAQARSAVGSALAEAASHFRGVADYWFRRVRGTPTPEEADRILALLTLALALEPGDAEAAALRARLLAGENALGMARHLDVGADFSNYAERYETEENQLTALLSDIQQLLNAVSVKEYETGRLAAQTATFAALQTILNQERALAADAVQAYTADLAFARQRFTALRDEVDRRKQDLEQPVDWGGVVVLGLFTLASFIISLYGGQTAAKIVGSIPDLMTFGNLSFTGSDQEAQILKQAAGAGGQIDKILHPPASGAKDMAEKKEADGTLDPQKVVDAVGPVLFSFGKFIKDLDEAHGDPKLKDLVKDLALALQQKLAAEFRLGQAVRQADLAIVRAAANAADAARYQALLHQAGQDGGALRGAVLGLVTMARTYSDALARAQVRGVRALEIYTLDEHPDALVIDAGRIHPDLDRDYAEGLSSAAVYGAQLVAARPSYRFGALRAEWDTFVSTPGVTGLLTHWVQVADAPRLTSFRQSGILTFTVRPGDLAEGRIEAKVEAIVITLTGVTADTPTFDLFVEHGGISRQLREGGVEVVQVLAPSQTTVSVGVPLPDADSVTGSLASPVNLDRRTGFWGRGVAAAWTLTVSQAIIQAAGVDLAGLTKVSVGLKYTTRAKHI
ncbi:hypothetical protein J5X84_19865 [Streptosporangiaceae bacterium NEAU-GS5]|nr:hypothetical protein [Streptosporangiaceae bacterium NEAU-GS5]